MNDTTTLQDVRSRMEPFLDSLKNTMDSVYYYGGGGEFKNYKKFLKTWEPRVGQNGTFRSYFQQQDNYWRNNRNSYEYISEKDWHELGPIGTNEPGQTGIGPVEFISIYYDGTPESTKYMLTGSLLSGIFYSTDAGESWLHTGTDTEWPQSGCSSAVFKPGDHTTWFASSSGNEKSGRSGFIGYNGGVWRTENEGKTWDLIGDKDDFGTNNIWCSISKVICNPSDPNTLFVVSNSGIFKTDSSNLDDPRWVNILPQYTHDFEFKPDDPSVCYATVYDTENNVNKWRIKISTDSGDTWTDLPSQPEEISGHEVPSFLFTIEVSKIKPDYLYCIAKRNGHRTLYYNNLSNNNGWITVAGFDEGLSYGDGHGFGVEQVDDGTRIILSQGTEIINININDPYNTIDLMTTHVDIEDIVFDPFVPNRVWICTHGGVEMTTQNIEDPEYCFRPKYNGLGVAEVERMATSPSHPERVVTGLYHDNTQYTKTPYVKPWSPEWNMAGTGDGMQALINHALPDHVLYSGQENGWLYTSNYFGTPSTIQIVDSGPSVIWSLNGVLKSKYPFNYFYRNKKYTGLTYEEVYRSKNYETTPENDYISNFRDLFKSWPGEEGGDCDNIYVRDLFTTTVDENCLLVTVIQEKTINNNETQHWRVMRTMNANASPEDILWLELPIPREDAWINDIEFQPGSTDIMYISYAPVSGPNAEHMIYKLDYTNINDPEFLDITPGLPLVPFGQLVFDNTVYKGLYLSTDAGVFYTNSEMLQYPNNQWELVGKNLPHIRGNGLDFISSRDMLRIGTWGRGVWELPIPCFTSQLSAEISVNTVWSDPAVVHEYDRDLIVKTGKTLTINPGVFVKFSQDAGIIIEPGAKVVVNGATLTNLCDDYYWKGIQVWGNTEASQYTVGGLCAQGRLIVENGATIENAWNAVTLWKPDDWHSTGGIVKASDSYFYNNKRSIEFMSYHNFNPNGNDLAPNLSSFTNCEFKVDVDYLIGSPFQAHITMWDVEGIMIKGCGFINIMPDNKNIGTGIMAMDSKFAAVPYCNSTTTVPCPEDKIIECTFEGLYAGIDASTALAISKPFYVNDADFNVNTFGVKASRVNFSSVINSTFIIGPNERDKGVCTDAAGYGIYMDNSTGFAIEENAFNITNPFVPGIYFGISINNTNGVDEIYKNTFNGLNTGNYASGKNWTINDWTGLTYFCDENTNNWADFYVVGEEIEDVIQTSQGNKTNVTGNTFSGSEKHFYNGTKNLITYYYCTSCPNETPDDLKIENVIKEPVELSNTCPSHYGGGGSIVLNSQQKLEREQEYATALINYNSVKTLYDNLKDGGSTTSTLADIQTAQPQDMWNLRAALLGDSPHLSEEVLKQVADKTDVFTESVIFDILAANPDELKREELLKYLEEKENPLPGYMIDILRQLATGTTYKTVLHLELSKHNRAKTRAAHDMIRSYLNDTVPDMVQLRNWLDNLGGIEADKQIIGTYVQEANFTDALALANLLPQLYALQGADLEEHNRFMAMLTLQQTLNTEDRKINALTGTELGWLNEVALTSKGGTGAQAKNILEFFYGAHFFNCQVLDDSATYKSDLVNPNELGEAYGLNISAKPNPAKDWAAFDYTLPGDESTAILLINDINGRTIESLNLNGNQGQKLWDTRHIPAGTYIYTMKSAGFSKTGKLVITK